MTHEVLLNRNKKTSEMKNTALQIQIDHLKIGEDGSYFDKTILHGSTTSCYVGRNNMKDAHGALAACGLKKVFIFKDLFPLQTSFKHTTVATCSVGQLHVSPWDLSFETIVHRSWVQFGQKHHDFRWTFHLVTVIKRKQQSTKKKQAQKKWKKHQQSIYPTHPKKNR